MSDPKPKYNHTFISCGCHDVCSGCQHERHKSYEALKPILPSGKICGKKINKTWTNQHGCEFSSSTCNGQKGHKGDCSPNHDCCGDRYPCYVTTVHCEFCGRNEGWCTSCLEDHEKGCAKKQIKKLKGQIAKKAKA